MSCDRLSVLIAVGIAWSVAIPSSAQQLALARHEATVLVEPYAPNVVRVSMSLRREDALAGPGYGISAKASCRSC